MHTHTHAYEHTHTHTHACTYTLSLPITDTLAWKFKPQQREIKVVPGETALAFFTAHNPTNKPVTGVATYNVTPAKAGIYFNKIQCFCFDEQRLKAGEVREGAVVQFRLWLS